MMHKTQAKKLELTSSAQKPIAVNKELAALNRHINFEKEGTKSSPRKTPTSVTCCKCRTKFILPFKPRKPEVYCDECFRTMKQVKPKFVPKKV